MVINLFYYHKLLQIDVLNYHKLKLLQKYVVNCYKHKF